MRFDTGSMFPPYSSYRNDPLGTKALFASLNRLPDVEATRYVDPLEKISNGPANQTVLMVGVNTQQPDLAPESFVEEVEAIVSRGGRMVLAFAPKAADFLNEQFQQAGPSRLPPRGDSDEEDQSGGLGESAVSIEEQWGIKLAYEPLRLDGNGGLITHDAILSTDDGLRDTIKWHNGLMFEVDDDVWRTIYEGPNGAVVAERTLGEGTLVFVGDSFHLTNEGLALDRQPELLSFLIGGNAYVQFDEQHLGMQRNPGAAQLMRRYGLESLIAGFIGLALLFAWRAGSSLAPRYSDMLPTTAGDIEFGRDAHAGFANLVQRSTPRSDVVGECVNQWRQSVLPGLGRADANAISEELNKIVNRDKAAAPVDTYRAVLNELQERNVRTAYDRKS
jgi:hypothetical protein